MPGTPLISLAASTCILAGITGMTHKQSYLDIGMCTVVIPLISTAVCIIFASMGVV